MWGEFMLKRKGAGDKEMCGPLAHFCHPSWHTVVDSTGTIWTLMKYQLTKPQWHCEG